MAGATDAPVANAAIIADDARAKETQHENIQMEVASCLTDYSAAGAVCLAADAASREQARFRSGGTDPQVRTIASRIR
jgi:hypothetical protein